MFWQEDKSSKDFKIPDDVVDLLFDIQCRELHVDHVHTLSEALKRRLPWLAEEDGEIGIHALHVAGSQNGWERPDPELGQKLQLSRRTKLVIRVPKARIEQIRQELNGVTLDIAGCAMTVGQAKIRKLSSQGTIFARHIVLEPGEAEDEDRFMQRIVDELKSRGIRVRKALCGRTGHIDTPDGPVATRSLMLAELDPEESVELQQQGLGPLRDKGCGIFLPHKGIDAVKKEDD
jgi:CRISPR-associated protein Cas6